MKQTPDEIILETRNFVRKSLENAEPGHDWWHAFRVWKLSLQIVRKEEFNGNVMAIEMAALLHDIADAKFHNGDGTVGTAIARDFMQSLGLPSATIEEVAFVIDHISFKGGEDPSLVKTDVLKIVQDADRIDALGAIGIARTFSYGGYRQRPMYDPDQPPVVGMTKEEYRKNNGPTINHFYEKLFLLKDLMNTKSGFELAIKRHEFMEQYLNQFYGEWNGDR